MLESSNFIDEATRAVFIEVLLHSSNTNLVTHVRLLLEFDSSGIVYPSARVTVAEADMYDTDLHKFRAFLESAISRARAPQSAARACTYALLCFAVVCAGFLLFFVADEVYFFYHMKLGDYFAEFDRILSLLLIALLSAVVGLRAAFITEYSKLPLPLTTVTDANSLINAILLLENEKQVASAVACSTISHRQHSAFDVRPQLLSILTILVHFKLLYYCEVDCKPHLPNTSCSSYLAGGRKGQRVQARYDRNERRGDVADVDLWSQHRRSCFVLLFSFQVC
jgi:hypothetical protein